MKRTVRGIAGIPAVLALALGACEPAAPDRPAGAAPDASAPVASTPVASTGVEPADGHDLVVAALERIARDSGDHPYQGEDDVRRRRSQLRNLGPEAPDATRWQLLYELGVGELRLGRERESIEALRQARALLPSVRRQIGPDWTANTILQLGVAWLRLGERENCCARSVPESCIIPLRDGAIHTRPEGSRNAIRFFNEVLEVAPATSDQSLAARWLLNIAHMTLDQYPEGVPEKYRIPESAFRKTADFPRFPNVAKSLGLDTLALSGSVIVDDFDGDLDLDILTSTWDLDGPMHYFRNDGDGFTDATESAGLAGMTSGLNMVPADYDNDGDLDVLVLRGAWSGRAGRHPNSLLTNDGTGHFRDRSVEAGLTDPDYPTQTAAWADYDLDGDLDLYVGNESGRDFPASSQLFRNEGDGTFRDVAREAGVTNRKFAKGVAWGDIDGDRDPDLYVSNLNGANRLYRNNGDGTFDDIAAEAGVQLPNKSFPVWFWDYDNDGNLDLSVFSYTGQSSALAAYYAGLDPHAEPDRVYRGDGRGGFEDVTAEMGLQRPTLPMGANFGDLDNDGFLDFYLGTGDPDFANLVPNCMFRNRGGHGFEDVTVSGGFGHLQKGHGVAFADLDHDGDLDVFEQMGGAYPGDAFQDALYRNPGFGHHWITLELVGTVSNRSAVGARIRAVLEEDGSSRSVYRVVTSGGSFGAGPRRQLLGLGDATAVSRLEIFWPRTGETQVFHDLAADRFFRITEDETEPEEIDLPAIRWGGRS